MELELPLEPCLDTGPHPSHLRERGELEEARSFLRAGEADPARGESARRRLLSVPLRRAGQSYAGDAGRGTEDGQSGREAGSRDSREGGRTARLPSPGPGSTAWKQETASLHKELVGGEMCINTTGLLPLSFHRKSLVGKGQHCWEWRRQAGRHSWWERSAAQEWSSTASLVIFTQQFQLRLTVFQKYPDR